jgi:tetratricopeptide (TPR) repeat protein
MSIGISKMFDDGDALTDQRRLTLAIQALEMARALTKIPDRRAWATYNLGAIHFHLLGDGEAARREFLAAIGDFESYGYAQSPRVSVMHANAIENAMLCALSFDEFEGLANRLRLLTKDIPMIPILVGLVPEVREARECGEPWAHCLLDFARRCYNRNDPKLDPGRYGQAKSTYHLLLTHRRELRVGRDVWGLAMYEYCVLAMRMATDCMKIRGGDDDRHSPEEYLPILTEALPLVDEYLAAQSGDDLLRDIRAKMQSIIMLSRERWALPPRSDETTLSGRFRCGQCHQPIPDPMRSCPACGSPSEVLGRALMAASTLALFGGGSVYHLLGGAAIWWRVVAAVITAMVGFMVAGSVSLQFSLGRFANGRANSNS